MKKVWPWVFGILIGLVIGALLIYGRSDRQSYWIARGPNDRVVIVHQVNDNVQEWHLHHYYER
jgi:hypothetical protein